MREVDWTSSILTVRVSGRSSFDSVLEGVSSLTADTRFDSLRFIVVDFLDAEWEDSDFRHSLEDLLAIMIGAAVSNRQVRVAIITENESIRALVDVLEEHSQGMAPKLVAFFHRESVETWVAEHPRPSRPSMRFRPR